jgi:hypothetical protein
MRVRSVAVALPLITLAAAGAATVAAPAASSAAPAALASCSKSSMAPYVTGVRAAAASFLADLAKYGGSLGPMSRITITLATGERVVFSFTGAHFRVTGSGLPTACRTAFQDDWLG